ncbi:hypothetical protein N9Y92_03135 [Chlamydiales bacterium]|nr:hypothetical protein [Chlamydiales bacterium]
MVGPIGGDNTKNIEVDGHTITLDLIAFGYSEIDSLVDSSNKTLIVGGQKAQFSIEEFLQESTDPMLEYLNGVIDLSLQDLFPEIISSGAGNLANLPSTEELIRTYEEDIALYQDYNLFTLGVTAAKALLTGNATLVGGQLGIVALKGVYASSVGEAYYTRFPGNDFQKGNMKNTINAMRGLYDAIVAVAKFANEVAGGVEDALNFWADLFKAEPVNIGDVGYDRATGIDLSDVKFVFDASGAVMEAIADGWKGFVKNEILGNYNEWVRSIITLNQSITLLNSVYDDLLDLLTKDSTLQLYDSIAARNDERITKGTPYPLIDIDASPISSRLRELDIGNTSKLTYYYKNLEDYAKNGHEVPAGPRYYTDGDGQQQQWLNSNGTLRDIPPEWTSSPGKVFKNGFQQNWPGGAIRTKDVDQDPDYFDAVQVREPIDGEVSSARVFLDSNYNHLVGPVDRLPPELIFSGENIQNHVPFGDVFYEINGKSKWSGGSFVEPYSYTYTEYYTERVDHANYTVKSSDVGKYAQLFDQRGAEGARYWVQVNAPLGSFGALEEKHVGKTYDGAYIKEDRSRQVTETRYDLNHSKLDLVSNNLDNWEQHADNAYYWGQNVMKTFQSEELPRLKEDFKALYESGPSIGSMLDNIFTKEIPTIGSYIKSFAQGFLEKLGGEVKDALTSRLSVDESNSLEAIFEDFLKDKGKAISALSFSSIGGQAANSTGGEIPYEEALKLFMDGIGRSILELETFPELSTTFNFLKNDVNFGFQLLFALANISGTVYGLKDARGVEEGVKEAIGVLNVLEQLRNFTFDQLNETVDRLVEKAIGTRDVAEEALEKLRLLAKNQLVELVETEITAVAALAYGDAIKDLGSSRLLQSAYERFSKLTKDFYDANQKALEEGAEFAKETNLKARLETNNQAKVLRDLYRDSVNFNRLFDVAKTDFGQFERQVTQIVKKASEKLETLGIKLPEEAVASIADKIGKGSVNDIKEKLPSGVRLDAVVTSAVLDVVLDPSKELVSTAIFSEFNKSNIQESVNESQLFGENQEFKDRLVTLLTGEREVSFRDHLEGAGIKSVEQFINTLLTKGLDVKDLVDRFSATGDIKSIIPGTNIIVEGSVVPQDLSATVSEKRTSHTLV